jgi:hypothetical protein
VRMLFQKESPDETHRGLTLNTLILNFLSANF